MGLSAKSTAVVVPPEVEVVPADSSCTVSPLSQCPCRAVATTAVPVPLTSFVRNRGDHYEAQPV